MKNPTVYKTKHFSSNSTVSNMKGLGGGFVCFKQKKKEWVGWLRESVIIF